MSIFLLVLGIILFVFLVIAHEFGHFLAARRSGVQVEEFGLFFPPRLWSKKMPSGFVFSINLLPLGGFVRLKGEHDADKGPGSFGQASLWAKTKIMVAGVFMNLLVAFVILTTLAVIGMPQIIPNQFSVASDTKTVKQKVIVGAVEPNSPASVIGLQVQDELVAIGQVNQAAKQILDANSLPALTQSFAGKKVNVTFINLKGQTETRTTTIRSSNIIVVNQKTKIGTKNVKQDVGYLGISAVGSPNQFVLQRSTWSAPIVALGLMKQVSVLTFQGLGHVVSSIFSGHPSQASQQVTGPVGVVVLLKNGSTLGYQFMLFIIAIISLSLALINVLPIPALDGGRLFFTLIPRWLTGRPLKKRTEELIHGTGLVVLLLLFVLITIVDIGRFSK